MRLKQLILQGFKSFDHKQIFNFPSEPGFYFINGINELEPELEGNGAGKSTLLDALCYVLYGKSTRKMTASDIHTWDSDQKTAVEVIFEKDASDYHLIRTWNPNKLLLSDSVGDNHEVVEQSDIDRLMGLDYESFLYSVLFSQFGESFFDLKPSPKAELFASILNLERWDGYSKAASVKASHLESVCHDTRQTISEFRGRVKALSELDFDVKIDQWERDKELSEQELKNEAEECQKSLRQIREKGKVAESKRKELKKAVESKIGGVEESKSVKEEAMAVLREISLEKAGLEADLRTIKKEQSRFSEVSGVCPYCGQDVDEDHIRDEVAKLGKKGSRLSKKISGLEGEYQELTADLNEFKREADILEQDLEGAKEVLRDIDYELKDYKRDAGQLMANMRKIEYELDKLSKSENPYTAEKKKVEEQIGVIEGTIAQLEQELASAEKNFELVRFWVKGFKEIRLFLISEVLNQLEVEVNNSLTSLGLLDWRIEFAVDAETKKGTIRKGFNVMIYSPYNTKPVPWEAWSGGESQRLRLAGVFGLANLILARSGAQWSLEIYDEPTRWLTNSGIQDLVDTLSARAREQNKQIFLIDHRDLDVQKFDGMYTVIKDASGSRIEYSN